MRGSRVLWQIVQSVPTVCLSVWACYYVYGYAKELSKPLQGVRLTYESRDGDVHLVADQVALDLFSASVTAHGVRVFDSNNKKVAEVGTALVQLPAAWVAAGGIRADIDRADLSIERNQNQKWNIEKLLPKKTREEASKTPFTISVEHLTANVWDNQPQFVGSWHVQLDGVRAIGAGESVLIRFYYLLRRSGAGNVELSFDEDGVSGRIKTTGMQLGQVLRHLRAIPELSNAAWMKRLAFESGSYKGSVEFSERREEPFRISGEGIATATLLRAGGVRADESKFSGSFNQTAAFGHLIARSGGTQADLNGQITYGPKLSITAKGKISARDYQTLSQLLHWPKPPAGLSAQGIQIDGAFAYADKVRALADVRAASVNYRDNRAESVVARLGLDGSAFKIWGLSGTLQGGRLRGELAADPQGQISGKADLQGAVKLKLPPGASKYFTPATTGISTLIKGSLNQPILVANLEGTGRARVEASDKTWVEDISYFGRLVLRDNKLNITAASANGPTGALLLDGVFDLASNELKAKGALRAIDISKLGVDGLSGIAFAQFDVTATKDDFRAEGKLEAYSSKFDSYEVPLASSNFTFKSHELNLSDLLLSSGASTATGNLNVLFGERALVNGSGKLQDVALSSIADPRIQGLVDGNWWLVGPLDDPQLKAQVAGENIVADKVTLKSASATVSVEKGLVSINDAVAQFGTGKAQLFGRIQDGTASFHLMGEQLPLGEFGAYFSENANVAGTTAVSGDLTIADGKIKSGKFEALAKNLAINDQIIGSGTAEVSILDDVFTGSGQFGSLEGYVLIEGAQYDRVKRDVGGTISLLDTDIPAIRRAASSWLDRQASANVRSNLNSIDGKISAEAKLSGLIDDPNIDFSFQTSGLQYAGRSMGDAQAAARRSNSAWNISKAELTGGPATLRLSNSAPNTIDENGEISIDGEINNIDLAWIASFAPELGALQGTVDIPFTVSGQTRSPQIVASVDGKNLALGDFKADAFDFGPFQVSDGQILAEQGGLEVRGLTLKLVSAVIPFAYPFEFPEDRPLNVRFSVPGADLSTLSRFFGGLDTQLSVGRLEGGEFAITGTPSSWSSSGSLKLNAERLKFSSVSNVFTDVNLSADLKGQALSIHAAGRGEAGGTFDLTTAIDTATRQWLPSSRLLVNDLPLDYRFENGSFLRGAAFGDLKMSGDLMEPLIEGSAAFDEALFDIRGEFVKAAAPPLPTFNPTFNVQLSAKRGMVRNGLMDVRANGTGSLQGTFESPSVDVSFRVVDGSIKLLTGPMKIEQGSVAHLTHRGLGLGEAETRLPIDLRATTGITSVTELNVQRYDVTLYITGDLLGEEDLNIEVQSDPPGLSKEEFIGLVGQKQLFATQTSFSGNFEQRLKDILSVVSPALLTPITSQLERAFGLDYIVLNFGSGTLGGVIVGKSLGNGFALEYRQPLNTTSALNELDQLALTYRPPVKNPLISRLTLGVGLNRESEMSFSLTYSRKFTSGRAKRK